MSAFPNHKKEVESSFHSVAYYFQEVEVRGMRICTCGVIPGDSGFSSVSMAIGVMIFLCLNDALIFSCPINTHLHIRIFHATYLTELVCHCLCLRSVGSDGQSAKYFTRLCKQGNVYFQGYTHHNAHPAEDESSTDYIQYI